MIETKNYKFILPDSQSLDIISDVVTEMLTYQQINQESPESGGLLLGYVDSKTNNETISAITKPQFRDIRTRVFYGLRDNEHHEQLRLASQRKNYFMGTWHTHPQRDPSPSNTDWDDWRSTLEGKSNTYKHVYFIIIGTSKIRIWLGDFHNKKICELVECERANGFYKETQLNRNWNMR